VILTIMGAVLFALCGLALQRKKLPDPSVPLGFFLFAEFDLFATPSVSGRFTEVRRTIPVPCSEIFGQRVR